MQGVRRSQSFVCARCLRVKAQQHQPRVAFHQLRHASNSASPPRPEEQEDGKREKEQGAFSRRLAQMTEENLETGGRSARKAVEEAGFSDDLKRELEEKIADARFRSENASAFAEANLPSSAGKASRDIAGAKPWSGTESVEDATLRMLTDAHKPLRVPPRSPSVRTPSKIDTGRPKAKTGTGARLLNARDRTSAYAWSQDPNVSDKERQKFREEMKQRFQPGARAVPSSIQGLTSLANERIEDAISRGQFKNLSGRGKKIERDYNASSPFINTTEYFMNKMIQKQEIVPPWIEKQQELLGTATRFRSRLRADWRRHMARMIASKGGSLEEQTMLAERFALAEAQVNPTKRKVEQMHSVDDAGHVSQITLAGELKSTSGDASAVETEIKVVEQQTDGDGNLKGPDVQVTVSAEQPPSTSSKDVDSSRTPAVQPFRDPQWEQTEGAYLRAAVDNLNSLTRSYNLMAPDLAKKPYFSLDRELRSCYADVAPSVANAIRERALAPKIRGVELIGHRPGSVMGKFAVDRASHVYDEQKPQYGFKQFWRDLFSSK